MDKGVVSDTLTMQQTAPWENTAIVRLAEAHERITELKRQPGQDILVFGSRTLWNYLLVRGLVDELHLMVGPSFLGGGTPVFQGDAPMRLRLLDSRVLEHSQLVLIRYHIAG
jgi:dihydrofolate reductase